MKNKRVFGKREEGLMKKVLGYPRIIGAESDLHYISVRKFGDNLALFVSVFPLRDDYKTKRRITADYLGLKSPPALPKEFESILEDEIMQQFSIKVTVEQLEQLREDLNTLYYQNRKMMRGDLVENDS